MLKLEVVRVRETTENNSELQFEAQTSEHSTPSRKMTSAQPAESVVVAPELASEAKTPTALNRQYLEHCRQKLSHCLRAFPKFVFEDILTKSSEIASEQLIEKQAAEISNPQCTQEFRNRIEIHTKPHSTSTVTRSPQLGSAQSSCVPLTVVQPVTQLANPTPPVTKDSTQVPQVRASLIDVQTYRQIELPQNLFAICIVRPNNSKSPNVDVLVFLNSEVVSQIHADSFYIADVGSTNGTYIHNLWLSPGDRCCISVSNF